MFIISILNSLAIPFLFKSNCHFFLRDIRDENFQYIQQLSAKRNQYCTLTYEEVRGDILRSVMGRLQLQWDGEILQDEALWSIDARTLANGSICMSLCLGDIFRDHPFIGWTPQATTILCIYVICYWS